jgi:hypothetical protein
MHNTRENNKQSNFIIGTIEKKRKTVYESFCSIYSFVVSVRFVEKQLNRSIHARVILPGRR